MPAKKKTTKEKAKSKVKIAHASGKRKTSIAKATIKEGKGIVRVNKVNLDLVKPELARLRIREPLMIAGQAITDKLNINITVTGGGWSSQSEAARLAIAKAIIAYTEDEELKKKYLEYDRLLLIADTRRKEQKKPGTHSRARAKRQKSKR